MHRAGCRRRAAHAAVRVADVALCRRRRHARAISSKRCLAEIDGAGADKSAPSSTSNLAAARAAADRSTARWRAGAPLSPIDGMPVGIKDIIETVDMPTEMGSPLFAGWRSQKDAACVAALRQAGAVIVGKTVTTEFAASEPRGTRNPWNLEHTPGGSSSGSAAGVGERHDQRGARHAGDRLDHPAGELLRHASASSRRSSALNREGSHDYQSQSCTGILAATLEDTWQVAHEIARASAATPARPASTGPEQGARRREAAAAGVPRDGRLGRSRRDAAKHCLQDALQRLGTAGIEIRTRHDDAEVAAIEDEIAEAHHAVEPHQ